MGLVGVATVRISEYGPYPTPLSALTLYSKFLPSEKKVVVVWLTADLTLVTVLVKSCQVPSAAVKPVVHELRREYGVA